MPPKAWPLMLLMLDSEDRTWTHKLLLLNLWFRMSSQITVRGWLSLHSQGPNLPIVSLVKSLLLRLAAAFTRGRCRKHQARRLAEKPCWARRLRSSGNHSRLMEKAIHWPGSRHFPFHVGDRGKQTKGWKGHFSYLAVNFRDMAARSGKRHPKASVMSVYSPKGL